MAFMLENVDAFSVTKTNSSDEYCAVLNRTQCLESKIGSFSILQPIKEDSSFLVRHFPFSHTYFETVLIKTLLSKLFVKYMAGASPILI